MNNEKRKLPRFHITPCQFHAAVTGKNFSVQDISLGGLAIRLFEREDLPVFAVGSIHEGVVKFEGRKLPARFQVKYIRGTLIGGEWHNPDPSLIQHLTEVSHPEILGEHLRRYDLPDFLTAEWFHNPIGVDLLVYPPNSDAATSSSVGRWTLYIHQNFVQWEMDSGLKTGQSLSEDEEGYAHGIVRLETRLIEFDHQPDLRLIETAREVVRHAPISDLNLKTLISNQLTTL